MDNKLISRVAVVLFAIVLAVFGLFHFIDPENLVLFVPSYMPSSHVWVYAMGLVLILASLCIATNRQARLASYILAPLLVVFALSVHLQGYLSLSDRQLKALSFLNMIQDLALACCVLYIGAATKTGDVPAFNSRINVVEPAATA
jgi:uncharacterized membrane protein